MPTRRISRNPAAWRVVLTGVLAIVCLASGAQSYEVPLETRERLRDAVPRTYGKLKNREPLHVIAVGDSVTLGYGYGEMQESTLLTYAGVFAGELAKEFFYTGGVREVNPSRDNPEKLDPALGPEITIENFSRGGAEIFYAFGPLTTTAFDNDPDLAILMYGINDSRSGVPIPRYAAALDALIKIIKAKGVDVIVVGPSATVTGDGRSDLGRLRPYAGAAEEVSRRNGVFFAAGDELMVTGVFRPTNQRPIVKEALADIVDRLRDSFDHGPETIDWIHPNHVGHRLLGIQLAARLLRPPPKPHVEVTGTTRSIGNGTYAVALEIRNITEADLDAVVVPLPAGTRLFPVAKVPAGTGEIDLESVKPADQELVIEAGKSREIVLTYQEPERLPKDSWEESFLRVPLLIVDPTEARLLNVNCPLHPVGVNWTFSSGINLSKEFTADVEIVNPTGAPIEGRYAAEWLGNRVEGAVSIPAGGTQPVSVALALPDGGSDRIADWLTLQVSTGGQTYGFRRAVDISRNMGLGTRYALLPTDRYVVGSKSEELVPGDGQPTVSFRAEADKDTLFAVIDIENYELVDHAGLSAVLVEFGFDGRYFEFRGQPGVTGIMTTVAGTEDGALEMHYPKFATFGNGYDRAVPSQRIPAALSTRSDGTRRITVEIPRGFFYLHEWALGNGNSSIGVSLGVRLLAVDDANPGGYFPERLSFLLANPGVPRRDAQGLATVELTAEPTTRWSVYVY